MQEGAEGVEYPQGLAGVALGEVRVDQNAARRFAQRVGADGREARVNGRSIPALAGQPGAQRLKGMQAQLMETLPLWHKPFLWPARKQIIAQVRVHRERKLLAVGRALRSDQPA